MTTIVSRRSRTWTSLKQLGLWGALDQVLLAGSGFVVAAVVARTGGPQALGLFALLQGGTLLFTGLLKASFADPLVIHARASERGGVFAIGLPLVAIHVLIGLITLTGWFVFGGHNQWRPVSRPVELILALLLPFGSFQELARSFRLASMTERSLFVGDLWVAAVRLATLSLYPIGVRGLPLGLACIIAGGITSIFTIRSLLWPVGRLEQFIFLWRLGRWLLGENMLYCVMHYGVWLLVAPLAGITVAGELRAGQQLFSPIQMVLAGLNVVLLGRLAGRNGERGARSIGILQIGMVASWGAFLVILGPQVASLVFGKEFTFSRSELSILATTLAAVTIFEFRAVRLRAAREVAVLMRARGAATAVTVVGVFLIGASFGGLMIAILAAHIVANYLVRRQ